MATKKFRLELDPDGIVELLQSEEVGQEVEDVGNQLALKAMSIGPEDAQYSVERFVGHDRQRVHVATANYAARAAEAVDRVLTRAKGSL